MKNYILLFIFLCVKNFLFSQNPTLEKELINLFSGKGFTNASVSFSIIDVEANTLIAKYNENTSLVPASVMKILTTAAATEILGPKKRFETTIQYDGKIDSNCVLNGNIYIRGGGDPCLGSPFFEKHYKNFISNWADSIYAFGIHQINGNIIADASLFSYDVPATWPWADIGQYYGAIPSGLSIYDNTCKIEFNTGEHRDSTHIACFYPYLPELEIDNKVKSANVNKDFAYIFGAPYDNERKIKGAIPKNQEAFIVKGAIPDPAYLAAFELEMELRNKEIKINGSATSLRKLNEKANLKDRKNITKTFSPSLSEIINITNMVSMNLYAEHLLYWLGISKYKSGDQGSGATALIEYWKSKGINTEGMFIYDGSGLSRFNAISSLQLAEALKYFRNTKGYMSFQNSLPIAGKSGTLKNMAKGTNAAGKVMAKSGTMDRIKSYAGYIKTNTKKDYAFAIIVNNYTCTHDEVKKVLEKFMTKISEN